MVFRSDITVDWTQSPRLIFVAAPSTEVIIQDLHDTLRILEERPWEGLTYPPIIETAGKEELGGSVTVGLTAKLLNAKLAFESRKISNVDGLITSTDITGTTLIDSTATFITNGIEPGAWVINVTDGSKSTVLKVISETQLLTDTLDDGIDNQFAINDIYQVQNVIQCEVSGGNLVAVATDGITSMSAILPTVGTQVARTSSSSATLQELQDIQFSSFNGAVTIDVNSVYSGIEYPIGTLRQPVNNIDDAIQIASTRGLINFNINGNITLISGINVEGKTFIGECTHRTTITVNSGALTESAEFRNLTIQGVLDGHAIIKNSIVEDISNISGIIEDCLLKDIITPNGDIDIWNCADGVAGAATPTIDCINNANINIRNYNGGLQFQNKNNANDISIDCNSARIILDNTVTNGSFIIRGIGKLIDNSTGTAVIDAEYLVSPESVSDAVWDKPTSQHIISGSMGEAIANSGLTSEQAKQLLIIFINSL